MLIGLSPSTPPKQANRDGLERNDIELYRHCFVPLAMTTVVKQAPRRPPSASGRTLRVPRAGPPASPDNRHRAVRTRCGRSEEHTSELQSLMRISYAVFCLKKKKCSYIKYK